ncbi:hypothetical protein H4R26_000324 [Coemansia thaxteri]|uniref:RING-type domain-containing protein n=1 Tax=Coemansia thaxteri TaxID=2663907 RepID=A0A9W8BIV8_9FUNG|nr:hypothetical protein H4R26_000324 [Coemansia thaxteri]
MSLLDNISGLGAKSGASGSSSGGGDRANDNWADRPSVLGCGHVFHQGCISAWLAQSNRGTCPTCRTKHTGEAIAIYFDREAADDDQPQAGGAESPQVKHRNKVIKTLCANIESAMAEAKTATQKLDEANARYLAKEQEHLKEVANVQSTKAKAAAYKKIGHELKVQNMKLEATIAEQARKIEELQGASDTLSAQLDEQKRVVEAMGDVRGTNERLVRSMKAERTRAETQAALNAQLATRIAALEKTNTSETADLAQTPAGVDMSGADVSQNISRIDLTETCSDLDSESLEEDTAAIGRSIGRRLAKTRKSLASVRRTAKFELPVAAFSGAESSANARLNPFAASPIQPIQFGAPSLAYYVPSNGGELPAKDVVVTSSRQIQGRHIRALRRPAVAAAAMSDGLGGSRQSGFGSRRSTSSVQSKINWGLKKS